MATENSKGFICSECGADLDLSDRLGGLCNCGNCSIINVLPKNEEDAEVMQSIRTANKDLFNSSFYEAFKSYRQTAQIDRDNPEIHFAMALANNNVKYVFDHATRRYQPVCYQLHPKEMAVDPNVFSAVQYASSDVSSEYEERAGEIDTMKAKFRALSSEMKCDVFICSKASEGSVENEWSNGFYAAVKNAGLIPFDPKKDVSDPGSEDGRARILFALKSAAVFVVACDSADKFDAYENRSEYTRYYQILSGEEREATKILIASNGAKLQSLPGIKSGYRALDIGNPDVCKEISEIISKVKKTRVKIKEVQIDIKLAPEKVSCIACGAELDVESTTESVCMCGNCGYLNPMMRAGQKKRVVRLISDADAALRNADTDGACKGYLKALTADPLESRAFFGMALAKNKISYDGGDAEEDCIPIPGVLTVDSMFSSPAIWAANAVAASEQHKTLYNTAASAIDNERKKYRSFAKAGYEFNCFIYVYSKNDFVRQRLEKTAEKLHNDLSVSGKKPFYYPIDSKSVSSDECRSFELFALSNAKSMIVICDSCDDLNELEGQSEFFKFYSMLPSNRKSRNGIALISKDETEKRLPGIPDQVKQININDSNAIDQAVEYVDDHLGRTLGGTKFCVLCEREVSAGAKLCPHCFSYKFDYDRSKIINNHGEKHQSYTKTKNDVVKWISDRARVVFISAAAFIVALLMLITISSIVNVDKADIYNKDYDVTVSVSSKIFDRKDKLLVEEYEQGTDYQWVKNQIIYKSGKQIEQMKVFALTCETEYDGAFYVKIPLVNNMLYERDRITAYCLTEGDAVYECRSEVVEKYLVVTTYEIAEIAIVIHSGDQQIGDNTDWSEGASGDTSMLYQYLEQAEAIDKELYTPASVAELENVYREAGAVFSDIRATQSEIDSAAENLLTSINMLVLRANFTALEDLIRDLEKNELKHEKRYDYDSFDSLIYYYEDAVAVLNNKNSTEEEVYAAQVNLEHAVENLEKLRTGFGSFVSIVLALAIMGVASYILSEEGEDGKILIVWIIGIIFLAIVMSNNPTWPWWKVTISELLGVGLSTAGLIFFL